MKNFFSFLLIPVLFLGAVSSVPVPVAVADGNVPVIRVGVYENAPKIYTDEEGAVSGFWPDLVRYIAAKEGWRVQWVSGTWTQGLNRLENGEIDIMPDTGWTEPRSRKYDFSAETVLTSWSRLYVPRGSEIKSIIDLNGKTVAALKDSFNLEGPEGIRELANKFDIDVTFLKMESYERIFEALEEGKIDAGVTNKDFGNRNENDYAVKRTPIIFQPARMQFAFTKDGRWTPFLIERIDAHMKELKEDNSSIYYQVLEKYFGENGGKHVVKIIPGWVKNALWFGGGGILFLLLVGIVSRVQVRRRTSELRQSEGKYRHIVESTTDVLFELDLDFNQTSITPPIERYRGFTVEEVMNQTIDEAMTPESVQTIKRVMTEELAKEGNPWVDPKRPRSMELQFYHKDGHIEWAEVTSSFKRDQEGKAVGISGVMKFITERKLAEEEKAKLERQLHQAQKMESLGMLAGGIAHDFNNILMGIMGNVSLAQTKMQPSTPGFEYLAQIETASQRAAELTNQMLAYSGKGRFVVQALDLSSVVKEMAHLLDSAIPRKVVLKLDLADNLPSMRADPTQIRQVIMNLIVNASEAISGTSGTVAVLTGAGMFDKNYLSQLYLGENLPEGKYVFIEVSDTGIGMDQGTIKHIFDPFFSTKKEGRGLGLSAVMGIIRGHNGAIKVYSEPGKGTTFKVLFPASEMQADKIVEDKLSLDGFVGNGIALVVDDEKMIRDLAVSILTDFGFETVVASDGHEAVDIYRKKGEEISFVLMDLTMPHMDGVEALEEMRQINRDVKVILSSGYNEQEIISSATGKGIAEFIQKPYRPKDLMLKVKKVLQG